MIVGICMVRDEADVIGDTLAHHLEQGFDRILCSDNLSTDDTPCIARSFDRVEVTFDAEPGYYQADKMTALAARAHDLGATWVVPFDADERIYCPAGGTVADFLATTPDDVVRITGWDYIVRAGEQHPSSWRRPVPQPLPKVCFRSTHGARLHMGNHDVVHPGRRGDGLALRHYQYRSLEQMARKLRNGRQAYEASNLHYRYGTHWREGGAKTDGQLASEWADLCATPDLVWDP